MQKILKSLFMRPEISAIGLLIAVIIGFSLMSPAFLSPMNMRNVIGILPELGLVAVGVTILMIAGEFDLSVGAVFGLTPMVAVIMINAGVPPSIAILAALVVAVASGGANGIITTYFSIPSFITTLGMLFILRSTAIVLSGGFPPPYPASMPAFLFTDSIGFFRLSLVWFIVLVFAAAVLLHKTNFGNWVFATGGQPDAAKDMGIPVKRVKVACFMICSTLVGIAGLLQTMRVANASPTAGTGMELEAFAAAIIGGTALRGGYGAVIGPVTGAILIRLIDNGIVLARIDGNYFRMVLGVLIIGAVIVNEFIRSSAAKIRT